MELKRVIKKVVRVFRACLRIVCRVLGVSLRKSGNPCTTHKEVFARFAECGPLPWKTMSTGLRLYAGFSARGVTPG